MKPEKAVRGSGRVWTVVVGGLAIILGVASLPLDTAAVEVNYMDTIVTYPDPTYLLVRGAFDNDIGSTRRDRGLVGTYPDPTYLLVRGAFEIVGNPQEWHGVYFQIRLDANTPLKEKDREGFVRFWNNIFTPENVDSARYTDCRTAFQLKDIEAATNLPKGKRTILWIVCDLWDDQNKQYIGSGWGARAPVIVTTDATGKITKVDLFRTSPFSVKKNHQTEKVNMKECELSLKHLKLKPGVKLHREITLRLESQDVLMLGDYQADLRGESRGYFFEPIDSAQKAAELVEIGFPRGVIIETPEQYGLIKKALKAKGWVETPTRGKEQDIPVEDPPSYGLKVTEEPGLGYRVTALMIDYLDYYSLGLRHILYREFAVSSDGRIGMGTETICIEAPQTPYGAPPGWTQRSPIDPEEYTKVLRLVLSPEGSRDIPAVIVTDHREAVPCAEDQEANWFEDDYDRWPEHANR